MEPLNRVGYFTVDEVAEILLLPRWRVRALLRDGLLKYERVRMGKSQHALAGRILISWVALNEFIEGCRVCLTCGKVRRDRGVPGVCAAWHDVVRAEDGTT